MSNYLVRGLHHIGIHTDDLQGCCDFYIRHLGFRMLYKKALPECTCWFVENHGLVLEFISRGKTPAGGPVAHIALEVCGIEALVAALKDAGVVAQDAEIGAIPEMFPDGCKNIFFDGPAGELIELFELHA